MIRIFPTLVLIIIFSPVFSQNWSIYQEYPFESKYPLIKIEFRYKTTAEFYPEVQFRITNISSSTLSEVGFGEITYVTKGGKDSQGKYTDETKSPGYIYGNKTIRPGESVEFMPDSPCCFGSSIKSILIHSVGYKSLGDSERTEIIINPQ